MFYATVTTFLTRNMKDLIIVFIFFFPKFYCSCSSHNWRILLQCREEKMWAWNAASLRIFSFVLGLDESDVLELSSIHLFSHESNFYHKFSFHAEFSESWVPRLRIPMVEEMLHLSHNFYLVDRDPLVSPSNLELNREYKGWSLKYEAHFFLQN